MQDSHKALLDAAAAFLWSDSLQQASDQFVDVHKHHFAGAAADGEQQLEWHPIYQQYCKLYEAALEGFVRSQGCSQDDFVDACRGALEHSEWSQHRGLASVVLSMADYDYFLRSMVNAAGADADEFAGPSPQHDDRTGELDPDNFGPPRAIERRQWSGDADDSDFM